MDVLKRIKSATLMEVLVATILIVVIFVVSSLVINNLLLNKFNTNRNGVENRLYELEYQYQNNKIKLPYNQTYQNWEISITKNTNPNTLENTTEFRAQKQQSTQVIIRNRIDE